MPWSHWEPCLQRITIIDCNAEVRDKLLLKQVLPIYIYIYLSDSVWEAEAAGEL
jgi:hypothetical protein